MLLGFVVLAVTGQTTVKPAVNSKARSNSSRNIGGRPSFVSTQQSIERLREVEEVDDGFFLPGNLTGTRTLTASSSNNNPLGKQFTHSSGFDSGFVQPGGFGNTVQKWMKFSSIAID